MSNEPISAVSKTKEDVAVFRAVVSAGLKPTSPLIHGLWRWFTNVDLVLPLPIMAIAPTERKNLALAILDDLDSALDKYEIKNLNTPVDKRNELNNGPEASYIDSMWKELAGVYADLFNKEVLTIKDEDKEMITSQIIESMSEAMGLDRDGVLNQIKTDPALKLSLRMIGLNPDEIS